MIDQPIILFHRAGGDFHKSPTSHTILRNQIDTTSHPGFARTDKVMENFSFRLSVPPRLYLLQGSAVIRLLCY